MGKNIRILFVEDSEDDVLILLNEIRRGGFEPVFLRVDTADDMRRALDYVEWDLVISDHKMPHFNAIEALKIFKESGREYPFIIVSGKIDEDAAFAVMRSGAHDYINKNNLKRLVPAIERELVEAGERKKMNKMELALQRSEGKYRLLFDKMMDAFALHEVVRDTNGNPVDFMYVDVNDAFAAMIGMEREKLIGKTILDMDAASGDELIEHYGMVAVTGNPDHFEFHSAKFSRYFEVTVFRPREGLVASISRDVSIKKNRGRAAGNSQQHTHDNQP